MIKFPFCFKKKKIRIKRLPNIVEKLLYTCVCMLVTQLCLTLWDPVDCSPPGSSVHWILQARILEWVAMPSSRGSSQPRDQTWVSCIAGRCIPIVCLCVSRSVVSDSLQPHRLQPARLLCPWDYPGKNIEWVAIPFSRGSSEPRDRTLVSCIAGRFFTVWATGKSFTII